MGPQGIRERAEAMLANPATSLTDKLDALCKAMAEKDAAESWLDEVSAVNKAIRNDIHDHLQRDGISFFKDSAGRGVRLAEPGIYAHIVPDKKEEVYERIKAEWNAAYAVQPWIPPATLSRLVKERLAEGKMLGDGIEYHVENRVMVYTKVKGGANEAGPKNDGVDAARVV